MSNIWSRLNGLSFPFEFNSPLGMGSWFVLAGVPVGIIALYFLKLRRRPVRVPSTILWRKSLEDLHVNSLFQRLRRNLLLFLQLLAVALAMIALAGPRMKGSVGQGQRFVLMIDNSASMSATDVAPSRLAQAKEAAKKVVRDMDADDLAMVITFADSAQVKSNYTGDRRTLAQRIDAIEPTQASTSLREGLQVAAGLANPSKQIGEGVAASSSIVTPSFVPLYRRRLRRCRGFQSGQPQAPGRRDRAPSPTLFGSNRRKEPGHPMAKSALETPRTTWRSLPCKRGGTRTSPRSINSSVASTTFATRRSPPKPNSIASRLTSREMKGSLVDTIALKLGPRATSRSNSISPIPA